MSATTKSGLRQPSAREKKDLAKVRQQQEDAAAKGVQLADLPIGIVGDLPQLAAEYIALNQQAKEIDDRKTELKEKIQEIHRLTDAPVIAGDFFVCEMVTSRRPKKVEPRLLLSAGVTMDIIEAATVGGDEYRYLQVRGR